MTIGALEFLRQTAQATVNELAAGLIAVVPKLVAGLVFLTGAYLGIRLVLGAVGAVLCRIYGEDNELVARLFVRVVGLFLWFGTALALLKVIGMGDVAASLGTAAGFIALGVSYALSNMIADTVAGVYLLRDPDFNPGDRVVADSVTGTVRAIELRKSRIELESGDVAVLANRDVEKKWTKKTEPEESIAAERAERGEEAAAG